MINKKKMLATVCMGIMISMGIGVAPHYSEKYNIPSFTSNAEQSYDVVYNDIKSESDISDAVKKINNDKALSGYSSENRKKYKIVITEDIVVTSEITIGNKETNAQKKEVTIISSSDSKKISFGFDDYYEGYPQSSGKITAGGGIILNIGERNSSGSITLGFYTGNINGSFNKKQSEATLLKVGSSKVGVATVNIYDGVKIEGFHYADDIKDDEWSNTSNTIFNYEGSTLNIHGGEFTNNTCNGGSFIYNRGSLNMSGGYIHSSTNNVIRQNEQSGKDAIFNMEGGIITGNKYKYMEKYTVRMKETIIYKNDNEPESVFVKVEGYEKDVTNGYLIYITGGKFNLSGGEIKGNGDSDNPYTKLISINGGSKNSPTILSINGSVIGGTSNDDKNYADKIIEVSGSKYATLDMNGAKIIGNNATSDVIQVLYPESLKMTNSRINNNKSKNRIISMTYKGNFDLGGVEINSNEIIATDRQTKYSINRCFVYVR